MGLFTPPPPAQGHWCVYPHACACVPEVEGCSEIPLLLVRVHTWALEPAGPGQGLSSPADRPLSWLLAAENFLLIVH